MSSGFDEASYATVPSPPFDSISSIRFSPVLPDRMLVSAWDTTVRLYQVGEVGGKPSILQSKYDHRAAILACAFNGDGSKGYSGGLDTSVRELDLTTEKITNIGAHTDSISSMSYSQPLNTLITGSWDRTIRLWDTRSPSSSSSPSLTQPTPERIYCLDHVNHTLVLGMASRLFHIYDLRSLSSGPIQERESSLKYMTRSLACMPSSEGFACASVEGRISVEYFDPNPAAQEKKYAFKCHRQTINDVDHVWPVNSLAFHPVYNTFASAGSDGTVSVWDHKVKKRLRQYPKFPGAVASVAFNCDGSKLAAGVSYTWDEGEQGMKSQNITPWIGVRKVGDEVKPKS